MAQKHYFLIGIGGIGMQAVARLLKDNGDDVSGSDIKDFDARRDLEQEGINVHIGHDAANITSEVSEVIYSIAVPEDNPEIIKARELKLPVRRRLELVGELMEKKQGIAISGTHGKTTTTTMISMMFVAAGKHPTALIGAEVRTLQSNVILGSGPHMIVEACEYGRSFMDLRPKIAVLTNIEADHLDYYKDLDEIKDSFVEFINLLPADGVVVANGDDENVREVVSRTNRKVVWAGMGMDNDYTATDLRFIEGRMHFCVNDVDTYLQVPGRHNVANAVLAWAVAKQAGIDDATLQHVLEDEFKGLARRFEIMGSTKGITFVDDYAHHPTEILAMMEGARQYFSNRRLVVIFHPHQYSRTRLLLNDFAKSFVDADRVIVAPIYAVRDTEEDKKSVSSEILVDEINKVTDNAEFLGDFEAIEDVLAEELSAGDVVITLGAGEADRFGRELLARLRDKE
jgi:UDP-N-acetylmuramate--alanine ligase